MPELDYQPLVNDLRVAHDECGGFHFVHLYDADDHYKFLLGEDEIKSLHQYLTGLIALHKL